MSYLPIQNRLLSLVKAQNHLKEIVERKKSKKFHILKYLPAFFLLFLLESNIIGQTTCGLSNSCLNNTPSSFKCITSSASASTLISGGVLLDATTALTTPQYLIVDGVITFDIDYTFASGSEIVFVSNTSGLIVDASERLTINFSHLHGCDDVWQGIKVLYGGEAVLRGNLIEDANNGLQLAIGSGSTPSQFSAVDNQFNRCYVGIAIGDCGGSAIKTINLFSDGISGNIFDGSGVMIDANSTTPLYGISIINIAPITIGKESANVNVFRGYDGAVLGIRAAGIYSFNSSLNVVNSAFEDIGSLTSASGNSGIQALFFDESSFLNVKGIGGGTLAGATFYNVYTGVTINRGNLKVTDAVFDIMRLGINYSPTPAHYWTFLKKGGRKPDFRGYNNMIIDAPPALTQI